MSSNWEPGREPAENIGFVHAGCVPPPAGAEPGSIKVGDWVKRAFEPSDEVRAAEIPVLAEHMWLRVTELRGDKVIGRLENDPVFCNLVDGDQVEAAYDQIEEVLRD